MKCNPIINSILSLRHMKSEYGLSTLDYYCLYCINAMDIPTFDVIELTLNIHKQVIYDIIKRLEDLKLVYSATSRPKAKSIFQLTSKGRYILNEIESYFNRLSDEV